ncbi:MAG TPA: VOC family protein [Sporichthyaceae bacterium]|jgi:catechol 2,3-dioxygenase-like lactoylglutathione lyase family enzyme
MALSLGTAHHIRLTVTDVERSQKFYAGLLGLQVAAAGAPPAGHEHHEELLDALQGGVVLTNGAMLIGLRPVQQGRENDRFDPFRVGLDHISFALDTRAELDAKVAELDEAGIEHGPVRTLDSFQLAFLAFFDPDGIALEFTAPIA